MRVKLLLELEGNYFRPPGADWWPAVTQIDPLSHPLTPLLHSTSFCTFFRYQHFWFNQTVWKEGGGSIIIFPRPMRVKLAFRRAWRQLYILDPQVLTDGQLQPKLSHLVTSLPHFTSVCNTFDREFSENKEKGETDGPGRFETGHGQGNLSFNAMVLPDSNAVRYV